MELRDFLVWLDTFPPLFAFIVGVVCQAKGFLSRHAIFILIYLLSCTLFNGVSNIVSEFYDLNNHLLFHAQNIVNTTILALYFAGVPVLAPFKKFILIACAAVICINIVYLLVTGTYLTFDSFGFIASSVMFTLCSMAFYFSLLQNQTGEDLFKLPDFWMVTGTLFYFASCFLIFLLYRHYIRAGTENIGILWHFQNIMLTILSIFATKGFLCRVSRMSPLLL